MTRSSIPCGLFILFLTVPLIRADSKAKPSKSAEEKFPAHLVQFTSYKNNPVFTGGGKGKWDERIRERGWILREGGLYKLWYTGFRNEPNRVLKLGYATSKDGIHWKRHPKNPLYGDHWTEDMMVVKHQGTYFMFAEGYQDRAHLLVSEDGVNWKRKGKLDVRKTDGKPISEGPYGTPTAFWEKGVWHLFYERRDLGIWLATSKDMKVWTNVQDDPVMNTGPDEYDKDQVAANQILKENGRYYLYYHGSAQSGPKKGLWCTCVATSKDLLHWEKYPGNPIQPLEQNKSSGILVPDGIRYRLYTMHPEVNLHFGERK